MSTSSQWTSSKYVFPIIKKYEINLGFGESFVFQTKRKIKLELTENQISAFLYLGTWFSRRGGIGLIVGLHGLSGLFHP